MCKSQHSASLADQVIAQPISAFSYLSKYPDFVGRLSPTLSHAVSRELTNTPVMYETPLDGIELFRGLLPPTCQSAHCVLLFRGWVIVGMAFLPAQDFKDEGPTSGEYVSSFNGRVSSAGLDTRELMRSIIKLDATKVMIATVRRDKQNEFDDDEAKELEGIKAALDLFSVELIDWVLLYPDTNVSWAWSMFGDEGMEEGVTIDVLEQHGIGLVDRLLAK